MSDLVKIDRGALLDLTKAIEILANVMSNKNKERTLEEMESDNDRLMYVNKLVITAMASFDKHNQ